jgi:hypothetical protein
MLLLVFGASAACKVERTYIYLTLEENLTDELGSINSREMHNLGASDTDSVK